MTKTLKFVSASELAVALGLDPNLVSRIVITTDVENVEFVSVKVDMLMTKESAAEFLNKSYRLAEARYDPAEPAA